MRHLLAVTLASSVALLSQPAAEACPNSTYYIRTLDNANQEIDSAEDALDKGHWKTALREAKRADTNAPDGWSRDEAAENVRRKNLQQRRQRVMGIAHLRLGHTTVAKKVLEPLVKDQPDDPTLQARYAELLAALGDSTTGRQMLADLETRDVMPDAAGWLALAKLHDAAGNIESRDRAIAGCKAMTRTKYKRNCAFTLTARPKQTTSPKQNTIARKP